MSHTSTPRKRCAWEVRVECYATDLTLPLPRHRLFFGLAMCLYVLDFIAAVCIARPKECIDFVQGDDPGANLTSFFFSSFAAPLSLGPSLFFDFGCSGGEACRSGPCPAISDAPSRMSSNCVNLGAAERRHGDPNTAPMRRCTSKLNAKAV